MKPVIFLFSLVVFVACTPKTDQSIEKTFNGELTLTPAESANLGFDRMIEVENDSTQKALYQKEVDQIGLNNNKYSLALFIDNKKVNAAKAFIDENESKLILERHNEFIWKKGTKQSALYLKDNSKSIEIGELVLSIAKTDSLIKIQFVPQAKRVLSSFSMKYLNRPIILEIDGVLITTVKAFGKLEGGLLEIKTYN